MTVGSDVKSCYVTIKSAEAGLKELSLTSTSKEHQVAFEQGRQLLQEIKQDMHKQTLFLAREEFNYK